MKKTILLLLSVIATVSVAVGAVIYVLAQFTVINDDTGVPVQLTNSPIQASAVTLIGMKAPQTSNTTTVWVSYGKATDGQQAIPVNPGSIVNLVLDEGRAFFVLSNVWFDVTTANDGLTVLFDQVK